MTLLSSSTALRHASVARRSSFADSLEGVDTVTLDYFGEGQLTGWRQKTSEQWKQNDQMRWRQTGTVPQTSRVRRDRAEVEL